MPDHAMPGMDEQTFNAFIAQLERFVRERLVPAEQEVLAINRVPDAILGEMRELGLFGISTPLEYGGAGMNVSQYIETIRQISWASPAFRSIISINVGMVANAFLAGGTEAQKTEWLPRLAEGAVAAFVQEAVVAVVPSAAVAVAVSAR